MSNVNRPSSPQPTQNLSPSTEANNTISGVEPQTAKEPEKVAVQEKVDKKQPPTLFEIYSKSAYSHDHVVTLQEHHAHLPAFHQVQAEFARARARAKARQQKLQAEAVEQGKDPKKIYFKDPNKIKGRIIPVDVPLTHETLEFLRERNPGFLFAYYGPLKRSTHPRSRVSRGTHEDKLVVYMGGDRSDVAICDEGGNAPRHSIMDRQNVFSHNPKVIEEDAARDKRHSQNPRLNRCGCAFGQDCPHFLKFVKKRAGFHYRVVKKQPEYKECEINVAEDSTLQINHIFVHSLYYIDPDELCHHMMMHPKRRYGSVHHVFKHKIGSFANGELIYGKKDGQLTVCVRTSFEGEPNEYDPKKDFYQHRDMQWMDPGYYQYGDKFLTWSIIKHDDLLETVEFHLVDSKPRCGHIDVVSLFEEQQLQQQKDKLKMWLSSEVYNRPFERKMINTLLSRAMGYNKSHKLGLNSIQVCEVVDEVKSQITNQTIGEWIKAYERRAEVQLYNEVLSGDIEEPQTVFDRLTQHAYRLGGWAEQAKLENYLYSLKDIWFWHEEVEKSNFWPFVHRCLIYLVVVLLFIGTGYHWYSWFSNWLAQAIFKMAKAKAIVFTLHEFLNSTRCKDFVHSFSPILPMAEAGYVEYYDDISVEGYCFGCRNIAPQRPDSELFENLTDRCHDTREQMWLYGPGLHWYYPKIASSCEHNERVAVGNRTTFVDDYSPTPEVFSHYQDFVLDNYDIIFNYKAGDTSLMSHDEFLCKYSGPRKRNLEAAYENNRTFHNCSDYDQRKTQIKAFIKREPICKDEEYDPRTVYGRHDEYNVLWGHMNHTFSDVLKRHWSISPKIQTYVNHTVDSFSTLVYASGMNRDDVGRWYDSSVEYVSRFGEPVFFENDFSRYDAHVTVDHIGLWQAVVREMFDIPSGSDIDWAMSKAFECHGNMRSANRLGDGYFSTIGNTKSGDYNTTCQNTCNTGCMGLYDLAVSTGCYDISVLQSMPFRMIVMGDDSYTITTAAIRDRLGLVYADLGIKAKPKKVEAAEGTFCSSIFVPSSKGTILTPLPGRMFAKLFWSIKKYNRHKSGCYAHAVCEGMLNDFAHVPFMYSMFERIIELTPKNGKIKSQKYPFHSALKARPSSLTYDMLADRYDLAVCDFISLETYLSNLSDWRALLDHPTINRMVLVDVGLSKYSVKELVF